jgi:hypothetical protein
LAPQDNAEDHQVTDTTQFNQQEYREAEEWNMKSYEEANASYAPIPPGIYDIRLKSIGAPEPVAEQWNPKGDKFRSQFTFELINTGGEVDDEGNPLEGRTFRQYFTLSLNEKSNFYPVAKALLGGKIDPATKPKPSDFRGKECSAVLELTKENSAGRRYTIIKGCTPAKSTRKTVKSKADDAPF